MPWYSFLLAPFAVIFRLVTELRNFLYDHQVFKSEKGEIKSIVVGNLSVGGTGKTPMVEFLIEALKTEKKLGVLSRGYGRKTKGFLIASLESKPEEIGDEPLQIFRKFEGEVPVFVCENRVEGIHKIQQTNSNLDGLILDDAFQHRRLNADFYILLTAWQKPFFEDFILPMGRLRESRSGARRADLVVVTKCPVNYSEKEKFKIIRGVSPYLKSGVPILFSSISYSSPISFGHATPFSENVILISGLADDRLFQEYCEAKFRVLEKFSFPDHHEYSEEDLKIFIEKASILKSENPVFLCTEKDKEKLKSLSKGGFLGEFPIFALPISVKFETGEKEMLLKSICKKLASK